MPPVPSAQSTVTCWPLAALNVTVNVRFAEPLSPSFTLGELTDSVGPSSFVIVPVPVPAVFDTAAFVALLSDTTTVSFDSASVSPVTDTSKLRLVVPAAKVSVPPVIAV